MSFRSVRAKLFAGFGALLLFLVVVGVLGLTSLGQVRDRAQQAHESATAPLAELVTAGVAINENRALTAQHVLSDDPAEQRKLEQQIDANAKLTTGALDKVQATIVTDKGHQIMEALSTGLTGARAIRAKVLDLSRSGDKAGAERLNTTEAVPAFDRLNDRFDALLQSKLGVAAERNAAIASTYKSSRLITIVLLVAALLIGAIIAFVLSRSISRGVNQALIAAEGISEGDVDQTIEVRSKDEIGAMAAAFTRMIAYLREMADSAGRVAGGDLTAEVTPKSDRDALGVALQQMTASLRDTVGQVQSTTTALSAASQQMASSSEETGRAVGEIANAVGEVAQGAERQVRMVDATRESAEESARAADAAKTAADEGVQAAERATVAMSSVRDSSTQAAEAIRSLSVKSEEIGGIVQTIGGIAEQTNLLALNAAIEAARAGDQGRGFAVVAEEVRKLAEESSSAAATISALIGQIQSETTRAVEVVTAGAERSQEGEQIVQEARAAFAQIASGVREVTLRIEEISTSANEVASVAEQSSASTEEVSASTEQTSASAQQIAASAQELARTAEELELLVGRFRLPA
jgi:methyl-accepting chemotaxis protein